MYLSYKWLKDFVEIPEGVKTSDLGTKLTVHTVEIDGVESQADKYKNIVVGKILEIKKHPKADKLQLALVDIKTDKLKIVCGAPNIKVGQMVPVALVGSILPNGLEIKAAVIRGEESFGMMCAEDELGMGEDHSGIIVLDQSAKLGMPIAEYFNLTDVIFEVDNKSITNRPDLWSHYGMAREISTFMRTKMLKDLSLLKKETIKTESRKIDLRVKIEEKDFCKRYMAVALSGIKIGSSPKWMQDRLISVGVRPINNIVDISNYVMFEIGQPMHMFDATKIAREKKEKIVDITVRLAKKAEQIISLDGETRELATSDLVIAGDQGAIAIAGVMGGRDSEIDDNSNTIVLESANFFSTSIRKTSQRLGLRSEASQRYEKSLDPSLCEMALVRAVELIKESCPEANICSHVVDVGDFYLAPKKLDINLSWLNKFLGIQIEEKEMLRVLSSLGFEPVIDTDNLNVTIPSWRATKDINIKEDIAEEIARNFGYDNIPSVMPKIFMQAPFENISRNLENKIRNILSGGAAMFEVSNYSFVGEEQLKSLGVDYSLYIRLANPISQNHTMLRQSLASNMIENVKKNQARFSDIKLFEMGSVYLPIDGNIKKSETSLEVLPLEEKRLALLIAGDTDNVYLETKSAISYLLAELDLQDYKFMAREKALYWSSEKYVTEIKMGDVTVGSLNMLDTVVAKKIGVKKKVALAEIYLGELLGFVKSKHSKTYKTFEKFPALTRDLAFILDENILYNNIKDEIKMFHEYISQVELFDEYHGDSLGAGKKSLAFHVVYQAEKTLESKEIDEIQDKLLHFLEQKFEAKIRNF